MHYNKHMQIVLIKNNLHELVVRAVDVFKRGGLVVYPTETCYGVGVDATNAQAVNKLLSYKERPEGKAISIAVDSRQMAAQYVEINQTAENLYKNFLPGPVTVISNSTHQVAKGIEAEDGSLGIRMPAYQFTLDLIKTFGKPITATSANMSGKKTPYKIDDILNNIPDKKKELIDLIIDAGELPHNPPSTVVDTRLNDEKVLRRGTWSVEHGTKKPMKTFTSHSEEETKKIGEELMRELLSKLQNKSVVFALQGDLGAGKTQFAKGVARALGIKENVTSPTFTIVKEYPFQLQVTNYELRVGQGVFYHIDTWRMESEKELMDLGFEEMIKPGNVVVVEWMQKAKELIEDFEQVSIIKWILIEGKEDKREIRIAKD